MQPVAPAGRRVSAACRPIRQRGSSRPRCGRSRRTAISSSCPIEQTPTSRCICSSTPATDARAIPAALRSPLRERLCSPARTPRCRSSSGPGARSALTRVAARPRERQPCVVADRRGSGRQQAHRRLPQSRQRRASGVADHNAGPSRAWRCVPLRIRGLLDRRLPVAPAFVSAQSRGESGSALVRQRGVQAAIGRFCCQVPLVF